MNNNSNDLEEQEGILYAHASIQHSLLKCPRSIFCELFTFTTSICRLFLELNDVYWELRSTNVFFKVSRYFCDESEFNVASLSPSRGQSFLS